MHMGVFLKINPPLDETIVLPGHDYKGKTVSTIGNEKATNPRVKLDEAGYVKLMAELFDASALPVRIQEVLQKNSSGLSDEKLKGLEMPSLNDLGNVHQLSPEELLGRLMHDSILVVDVREPSEIEKDGLGVLPGGNVTNVPFSTIADALKDPRYCYWCFLLIKFQCFFNGG